MKPLKIASALGFSCILSACATAGVKKEDSTNVSQAEYLPFVVLFKADGTPVIKGRDGVDIQGEEVTFPVKATAIESLETISYIKYKGSCKVVMYIAGKYIQYTLPDIYCQNY